MVRRAWPEHPTLPSQLPLTQPRWAVGLGWAATAFALAAVVLGGAWQGVSGWVLGFGVGLSILAQYLVQRRQQAWQKNHHLCFRVPQSEFVTAPSSFLGTFSKNTGQSTLTPVTLQQHWTHIFGLTLRLNLHNHPHNKPEVVTVTLWRSQLPAQTYRRLNIWAAWQRARCTPLFKGDTA
ncbi:MAG: hypothetical protein WCG12_11460 [Alcaligenaceae bacterium]